MKLIVWLHNTFIVAILLFVLDATASSVNSVYDLIREGWGHQFTEDDFGVGLNSRFRLSVGEKYSYAGFIISSYYEWDKNYSPVAWPPIVEGDYFRPSPIRYISNIEMFTPLSKFEFSLGSRVRYFSYVLPHIPNQLQSRITSNENKTAESDIFTLPKGYSKSLNNIEFQSTFMNIAKKSLTFKAKLSKFTRNYYFGAVAGIHCQSDIESGAVTKVKIVLKKHIHYAPEGDLVIFQAKSDKPTYLMKIRLHINLDRIFKSQKEEDSVTFVATCNTNLGNEYTSHQRVIIKESKILYHRINNYKMNIPR
ncbi:hypothetical protein JYT31_02925 [Beggiatoa alba]|nr:hypothetical protein [Beggiatoa alba]